MEKKTLYKYFEGTATRKEKKAIKEWLDSSENNYNELLIEREFFDAVILSNSHSKIVTSSVKRPQQFTLAWLIKVAVVILLVSSAGLYFYKQAVGQLLAAEYKIVVPAGQRSNLLLPDGTDVWINARSEMSFSSHFTGKERIVNLDGEAYFDVAPDSGRPFIVKTKSYNIKVLGTKFNIESYSDAGSFAVALMEGSIQLEDALSSNRNFNLKPGQKVDWKDGKLILSRINDYDIYRWKEGLICFKETNFIELMQRFEKCYGIPVVVENDLVKQKVFSGKFRISDGIDNALRVLQKEGNYIFERNREDSIVYIR